MKKRIDITGKNPQERADIISDYFLEYAAIVVPLIKEISDTISLFEEDVLAWHSNLVPTNPIADAYQRLLKMASDARLGRIRCISGPKDPETSLPINTRPSDAAQAKMKLLRDEMKRRDEILAQDVL